jgi:aminoglycoside/choline kinase family phosphotransferase
VGTVLVDERRDALCEWIGQFTPYGSCEIKVASSDASFRRYFRMDTPDGTRIIMDSPPHLEPCEPFIEIGKRLVNSGIQVPKIYFQDPEQGFLVLSDFGDQHFQDILNTQERNERYADAIQQIVNLQIASQSWFTELPIFDRDWQAKELEIFREWCLPDTTQEEFASYTAPLIEGIDAIPKCMMHRDFHCRNLLVLEDNSIGIIDFQGAMNGPITYDLVSLLRDCYVDNSEEWISQKIADFRTQLIQSGLLNPEVELGTLTKWFDWAGLQRHLKCVGIFHRLKIRDGKPKYLADVPRVLSYIDQVLSNYPELCDLKSLVSQAQLLTP